MKVNYEIAKQAKDEGKRDSWSFYITSNPVNKTH